MDRMQLTLPERRFAILLALFSIPLLFLPKISLLSVSGETAGVRIDDFVLLFLSLFVLLQRFCREQGILKIEFIFLCIFFSSLLSFFINYTFILFEYPIPNNPKILYTFRFIEYILFFYLGYYASRVYDLSNLLFFYLLYNGLLLFLQKFNVIGGFSHEGYSSQVGQRTQGISSFPAEMGLILNILFCYFCVYSSKVDFIRNFHAPFLKKVIEKGKFLILTCFIFTLILFTGARVAVVAFVFTFLWMLFRKGNRNIIGKLFLVLLLFGASFFFITKTKSLYERTTILSFENLSLIKEVWNAVDLETTKPFERVVDLKKYNVDVSWWMRLQNWIYFSKFYITSPHFWLFGLGPGSVGHALDGSLLRIILEGGVIGGLLYFLLFYTLANQNFVLKLMAFSYVINMLFFDAHLAYKSMSLLLFISGYFASIPKRTQIKLTFRKTAVFA